MATNPNTDFVSGAILTAGQQNRFGRGIMAYATSGTAQNLSTTQTIATGMTVTFTAVANRGYKITYFEPAVECALVAGTETIITIKKDNAATTALSVAVLQTTSAVTKLVSALTATTIQSFTAGSVTLVGAASVGVTTGTPALARTATRIASFIVEDIGPV